MSTFEEIQLADLLIGLTAADNNALATLIETTSVDNPMRAGWIAELHQGRLDLARRLHAYPNLPLDAGEGEIVIHNKLYAEIPF